MKTPFKRKKKSEKVSIPLKWEEGVISQNRQHPSIFYKRALTLRELKDVLSKLGTDDVKVIFKSQTSYIDMYTAEKGIINTTSLFEAFHNKKDPELKDCITITLG